MGSNKSSFPLGLALGMALSLGLFFSWQSISAIWAPPASSPPDGNVAAPVNVGTEAQYKAGNGLGLDRLYSTTGAGHFYVDSTKGLAVHLDTDGNDVNANTTFEVKKDDNLAPPAFSVNEDGEIKTNGVKLFGCSDGQFYVASSTSLNKLECANGLTYGE